MTLDEMNSSGDSSGQGSHDAALSALEATQEFAPDASPTPEPQAPQQSATDFEKQYKELQPAYTKSQQRLKELEAKYKDTDVDSLKQVKQYWDLVNSKYAEDKDLRKTINKVFNIKSDEAEVPEDLQQDPLWSVVQNIEKKHQQEINQLRGQLNPILKSHQQAEAEALLSKEENAVKSFYKEIFGSDIPPDEMNKVLSYMHQNKITNGESVAKTLFFKKALEAAQQKAMSDQMSKKNKSSVVSKSAPKGGQESKSESLRDLTMAALIDSGYQ